MKTRLQISVLNLEQYISWVESKVDRIDCDPKFLIALRDAVRIAKEETAFKPVEITAANLRAAVAPYFIGNSPATAISDKIPWIEAVKALRKVCIREDSCVSPMRIDDARWAVFNWKAFIEFVESNNRLPQDGYHTGLK